MPHRVKQIIAITMGVILLIATIAAITRDYSPAEDTTVSDNQNNTVQNDEIKDKPDTEANKEDKKEDSSTENNAENDQAQDRDNSDTTVVVTENFVFTATPGDYYTAFARDAIRQYAVKNKLDVSEDRVQQSAASLAYQAGSPFLEVGQIVTINANDISTVLGNVSTTTPPVADTPPPQKDTPETPSNTAFSYTAVAGDSYVLLARRSIDELTKSTNTTLSPEQRIAAETFIISDAGFPAINTNQQVSFQYETIMGAVAKATSLSPAQLQNWQPYAELAGFYAS